MFGTFVRECRATLRLGLREFCLKLDTDPSNWSKIERDIAPPPQDEPTLRKIADALQIKEGSDDWKKLSDYAATDAGKIPDYIMKDEELVEKLPVFFRTLEGRKPTRKHLEELAKILKTA